jgi:hypothetical protein
MVQTEQMGLQEPLAQLVQLVRQVLLVLLVLLVQTLL